MKSIDNFLKIIEKKNFDNFLNIDGIGETQVNSFSKFFKNKTNYNVVFQLSKILLIEKRELNKRGKLLNKTFMFTGKLKGISRAEAKTLIEKNSGSIVSTVNKKLNFLVTGEKPTNKKINHANQLGVKILSQEEWFKILN